METLEEFLEKPLQVIAGRISEGTSDAILRKTSDVIPGGTPIRIVEGTSNGIPEEIHNRIHTGTSDGISCETPDEIPRITPLEKFRGAPDRIPGWFPGRVSKRTDYEIPKRIPDVIPRRVSDITPKESLMESLENLRAPNTVTVPRKLLWRQGHFKQGDPFSNKDFRLN